jgi:hypothetical protein
MCGCRHGHERECVLPLPLGGEGYNLVRTCAGMLHTHLMRSMESWARVVCMAPFLAGGAVMTASSEQLVRG